MTTGDGGEGDDSGGGGDDIGGEGEGGGVARGLIAVLMLGSNGGVDGGEVCFGDNGGGDGGGGV